MAEMKRLAFEIDEWMRNGMRNSEIVDSLISRGFSREWATEQVTEYRKVFNEARKLTRTKKDIERILK